VTRRVRGALLAAAAFATVVVVPAGAGCAGLRGGGRTASVPAPAGSRAESLAVAYAKSGRTDALYVLTPRTVLRSTDGGCSWRVTASLDDAPSTSPEKTDTFYEFVSLAVSPAAANGGHTVYAVATERIAAAAVTPPVVVATSTDDGAHWTYRDAAPADLAGDYPRCGAGTGWTVIRAGSDPATAYLRCETLPLAELALMYGPGECQVVYYATHDGAKTWQAVSPRFSDPAKVSVANPRGCDWRNVPQPDRTRARVVWDVEKTGLLRSADDGRTWAPFATLQPARDEFPAYDAVTVNGRIVTLLWDATRLGVSTGGAPRDLPPLPIKSPESGFVWQAAIVPGSRDVVAFYRDVEKRSRTYRYSDRTKRWTELPGAPVAGSEPGWRGTSGVALVSDTRSRDVYLANDDAPGGARIARYSL
jgi:hypothetical protein